MARYLWPFFLLTWLFSYPAWGGDLDDVRARGVVRHLGIPYAHFVTGSGDGLDTDIIRLFATSLGLSYVHVPTTWKDAVGDLTGNPMDSRKKVEVKGDLLANGVTILEWRKRFFCFSTPVFPSQIWLIAGADDPVTPIVPGDGLEKDISRVRNKLRGREVTGMARTCLDPGLYGLEAAGASIRYFNGQLNDLAPAVMNKDAQLVLMDAPDALVAIEKWPGRLKVIGPVSDPQHMGVAFRKNTPELKAAFNRFFRKLVADGTYQKLVEKYYPVFPVYYPRFFAGLTGMDSRNNK
ncbi:MAG: transporter substrate-binding domain-containing protein [Desulfobacter sp.]